MDPRAMQPAKKKRKLEVNENNVLTEKFPLTVIAENLRNCYRQHASKLADFKADNAVRWNKLIRKYKVTILQKGDYELLYLLKVIQSILSKYTSVSDWNHAFTEEELQGLDMNGLPNAREKLKNIWGENTVITLKHVYLELWKSDILPLIIKINRKERLKHFLEVNGTTQRSCVIIYEEPLLADDPILKTFKKGSILHNFSDLKDDDQNSLMEQTVQIMGKEAKLVDHLTSEQIKCLVYTGNILGLISNKYAIGNKNFIVPLSSIPSKESTQKPGTWNQGWDYESLMTAVLLLRLIYSHKKIENLNIKTNISGPSKFDDIKLTFSIGNQHYTFYIQLKHAGYDSVNRNNLLTFNDFKVESGNYSFPNYWKSVDDALKSLLETKIDKEHHYKYVIFTNKSKANDVHFIEYTDDDVEIIKFGGDAFSFEKESFPEISEKFLNRAVILCSQPHEETLYGELLQVMNKELNPGETADQLAAAFIVYIDHFRKGYYGGSSSSLSDFCFKLAEFASSPFTHFVHETNFNINHSEWFCDAMNNYQAWLFDDYHINRAHFVPFIFKHINSILSEYTSLSKKTDIFKEEDFEKLNHKLKERWPEINVQKELEKLWGNEYIAKQTTLYQVYVYLSKVGILPRVLMAYNEENLDRILRAIPLCRNSIAPTNVIIFCNSNCDLPEYKKVLDLDTFKDLKIVRKFSDLCEEDRTKLLDEELSQDSVDILKNQNLPIGDVLRVLSLESSNLTEGKFCDTLNSTL